MTTPIYSFPYPALGTNADGPAAFQALGTRVEREMSTMRTTNYYRQEAALGLSVGNAVQMQRVIVPTAVIGWAQVEVELVLVGLGPITDLWAGFINLFCNNALMRSTRYHNKGLTTYIDKTVSFAVAVTAATTILDIHVDIVAEGNPHNYQMGEIAVFQFGAPSTG